MLYVKFIQNWNDSELNAYPTATPMYFFHVSEGIDMIYLGALISPSVVGESITINDTFHNNGTYTIETVTNYPEENYQTILRVTESVENEDAPNGSFLLSGTVTYTEIILKNTSIFSHGLKLKDIDYDAESYMADDFFLREPREAKIELYRDADDWLRDNFLYQNDNEINHVLYLDEDGSIINYNGVDPGWQINTSPNGVEIVSKEVLIQQFSKIIVEIYDSIDNETPVFTGLVDKSQTTSTHRKITLNCIDFTGLIKIFGEQLIKILTTTEDDEYYQFIVSENIINDLLDKIKKFTKLELQVNNNTSIYGDPDSIVLDHVNTFSENDVYIELSETSGLVSNNDPNHNIYGNAYVPVWNNTALTFKLNSTDDSFIIFSVVQVHTWLQYYGYDYYEIFGYRIYNPITQTLGDIQYYVYYTGSSYNGNGWSFPQIHINAFTTFINLRGTAYYGEDEDGENTVWIASKNISVNYEYTFHRVYQDRYSVAIPIYADTYKYIELFKTILFLNILTIYADGNGNIFVKSKYFKDEVAGESTIINERDIMDGYTLGAIEKDELEMSDALEPIWYDTETEGALYDNLDNKMKEEFSELFISRFPIEFNGEIRYPSVDIGTYNDISVGSKLDFFNRYWIVVSSKLNKTGHKFKIKAFGLIENGV